MKNSFLLVIFALILTACTQTQTKEDINLSFPDKLVGVETIYTYSGGNAYAVKFEEDGLSYQFRSGAAPEKWWGKFDYNHMLTAKNEHFVSWFEPSYGDYVTLLINFETNTIYGSAIIKGKTVHFQQGKIEQTTRP
jgi:phenolic acid decarboxylase